MERPVNEIGRVYVCQSLRFKHSLLWTVGCVDHVQTDEKEEEEADQA